MKLKKFMGKLRTLLFGIVVIKNNLQTWKAISLKNEPCTFKLRNGLTVHGPDGTGIIRMFWNIFKRKEYTPKGYDIGSNDVVVDIGANIGIFTLYAATITTNIILAYEPFPENVFYLKHNINNNDLKNVRVFECAVADSPGNEELIIADTSWGHMVVTDKASKKSDKRVIVPSVSLKNIITDNSLTKIDFLKMDCEGAEGAIFSSLPKDCFKRIGKIALEFHNNVSCKSHKEIASLLKELGFNVVVKWNRISDFGYLYAKK